MTSQPAKQLLQQGIARFHMGDRTHALELIEQAAQLDPYNEQAWLWLAGLSRDLDQRRFYLNQVLLINPQNAAALQGLEELRQKPQASLAQLSQLPLETSSGKDTINLQTINLQALHLSQNVLQNLPSDAARSELVELIIKELQQHNAKSHIILKIGQSHHLTWNQSETLIDEIAEQYKELIYRKTFWNLTLSPIFAIGISLAVGLFAVSFSSLAPESSINPMIISVTYTSLMFFLLIMAIIYTARTSETLSIKKVVVITMIVIHFLFSFSMLCISLGVR